MSQDEVGIKVRVDASELEKLSPGQIIQRVVEGMNNDDGSTGTMPAGAPNYAPKVPAPYSQNYSQGTMPPMGSNPGQSPYGASGPSVPGSYGTAPSPLGPPAGYYAPPPPGQERYSEGTIPPTGSNVGGQFGTVNVAVMTVHAATVNLTAGNLVVNGGAGFGAASAGSAGGGGGTGQGTYDSGFMPGAGAFAPAPPGAQGAGGGAGGGNGGGPPFRFQPGDNPLPVPDSGGGFLNNVLRHPTLGGAFNALLGELPLGPSAAIGAMGGLAAYGVNAAYAYQRPSFEIELQQKTTQLMGNWVNPSILGAQQDAARLRGQMGMEHALLAPFNAVTFGMADHLYGMSRGQYLEDRIATTEASGSTEAQIKMLAGLSGSPWGALKGQYQRTGEYDTPLGTLAKNSLPAYVGVRLAAKQLGNFVFPGFDPISFITHDKMTETRTEYDEDKTKHIGAQLAMRQISLAAGRGEQDGYLTNPVAFGAKYGSTLDKFTDQGLERSYGALFNAQYNDRSQIDQYRHGEEIDSPGNVRRVAEIAASRGQDVTVFQPELVRTGQADYYEELKRRRERMLLAQNKYDVAGSGAAEASAKLRELSVTGANYNVLNRQIEAEKPFLQAQIKAKQTELDYAQLEPDRARLRGEIAGLHATVAGFPATEAGNTFGQRGMELGAREQGAQLGFEKLLNSGADEHTLAGAFQARRAAEMSQANLLREQVATKNIYSDAQKDVMRAEIQRHEYNVRVGLGREQADTNLSFAESRAGLTSAGASFAATRAELFGNSTDLRESGAENLKAISEQLRAVEQRIQSGNLRLDELNRLQARAVSLQESQVQISTETARAAAQMDVNVARSKEAIAGQAQSRALMLGSGGMAAYDTASKMTGLAGASLSAAQRDVDLLVSQHTDPNSLKMLAAQDQLESAKTKQSQSILELARTPFPLELTQSDKRQEFTLSMLSRTFAPMGNIRGALGGLMGNAQKELETLHSMEVEAERTGKFEGPEGPKLRAEFEDRRMEVGNRAIGFQQQLEQGWSDRLISSVVNAPSSTSYIDRSFTMHEAAGFLGGITPQFGFTNTRDRDRFLFRGPRIANSLVGNITQPGAFGDTAMSGYHQRQASPTFFGVPATSPPTGSHVGAKGVPSYYFDPHTGKTEQVHWDDEAQPYRGLGHPDAVPHANHPMMGPGVQHYDMRSVPPSMMPHTGMRQGGSGDSNEIVVRVIIQNQQGNTLASQAKVIHDLGNGALNFAMNPHAAAAPRL